MTEPEEDREKAPKTDAVLFKGENKNIADIRRHEEDPDRPDRRSRGDERERGRSDRKK
ncbi:hypothetical protein [Asanoa siamensis]|uniref:Uncharacterized protein n=1 Tax=Asanoa siamensis TaxID=926357 RepID=A0ABQ4CRP9_9ACTN|nr:hypothetical protein [Asanoa siamensis]GIF73959.1 hypothetical protein Asi02nite_34770 [Asanoa siamensis]